MHAIVKPLSGRGSLQKMNPRSNRCGKSTSLALLAAAVASVGVSRSSSAATGQWITDGGGNWSAPANWNGGTVPNATDDVADFNSLNITLNSNVVLDVPVTLGSMIFGDTDTTSAASYTISGTNALTLATSAGTPTITVNGFANPSTTGVTISAAIAGAQGLNKDGTGLLVLTTTNSWTGGTTITNGTLQIGAGGAGATLGSGAITNNGTLAFNQADAAYTVADGISGTGSLTKAGTGQLSLSGTNTYSGTTTVNAGLLTFAGSGAFSGLAANSITMASAGTINTTGVSATALIPKINAASVGTLAISLTDAATNFDFTPIPGVSLGVVTNDTVSYTGTISPAAGTYRVGGGGGTLQLANALTGANNVVVGAGSGGTVTFVANNTYSGTTTISSGTLRVGATGATGTLGTGDVIGGTGTLTFDHNVGVAVPNNIAVNQLNLTSGNVTSTGAITASGTYNISAVSGLRWTVNGGSMTVTGLGTIGNAASFAASAGTTSFAGNLRVGTSNDATFLLINGGALSAGSISIPRSSNFGTGAAPTAGSTTSGIYITSGSLAVSGNLDIATSNSSAGVRQDAGNTTYGGVIIGHSSNSRWSIYDVNGGTMTVTGATGIQIADPNAGDTSERGVLQVRAGTATTTGISFGDGSTSAANETGDGLVQLSGGNLYVGANGITKTTSTTFNGRVIFASGTLGAAANWTSASTIPITFSGTTANSTIAAADSLGNPFDITLAGTIGGTGSFTKTGGGILDLQGTNAWAGTGNFAVVNAGTLAGRAAALAGTIVNNSTVAFNDLSGSSIFAGVVSGTGAVTKTGAGISLLNSGQTYTGATTITAGALGLRSTLPSSGVTVSNGGGLMIRSGGATVSNLTFGATGSDAQTFFANDGTGLSTLTVTGALTTNGTTSVDVGTANIAVGTKVLIDYTGSIAGSGFAGFTLGALPPRMIASLVNNTGNTSIDLNVTGFDLPRWNGNINGDWDINTTANWRTVSGDTSTTYLQSSVPGDQVLFNDLASGTTTVNITTTVQPANVTVNNSNLNYTFTGTGKISGATPLLKQGTGSLTINNTGGNDYSGGTTIQAGTLVLGNSTALPPAGNVTVSGGTFDLNGQNPVFSGGVTLSGGTITNGTITKNNGVFDLQSGTVDATATLNGTAGLSKSGTGTAVLAGSTHAYTGLTTVIAGTLQLGDGVSNGSTPGNIANSGTVAFNNGGEQIWTFSITGTSGTIVKNGPQNLFFTGVNDGNAILNAGTTIVVGPGGASVTPRLGRGGTITINNGATLLAQNGNGLGLGTGNLPPNWLLNAGGTLKADAGADLSLYNGTFAGGILTADGSFNSVTLRGDYVTADNTASTINVPGTLGTQNSVGFTLGTNSTLAISSNMNGTTATTFTGPGVVTLSGDNSQLSGGVSVAAGAVVIFTTENNLGALLDVNSNPTSITLNSGTLRLLAPVVEDHNIRTTGGGTIDTNGNDASFTGTVNQNGGLTKAGSGLLVLTSTANTYTGNTTVSAGTLQIPFGASAGTGNVVNNATFLLQANAAIGAVDGTGSMTIGDGTNAASVSATHFTQNSLTVSAGSTATVNPSGGTATGVSKVGSLTLGAGAKLNLQDNKLITGTSVATITNLIASGRNGGGWTGNGIVTSQSNATGGNFTSIGVATAAQVKGIAASATAVWAGQTVTGSDTLVMYTYGGDANLDGRINVDDYGRIDFNVNLGTQGWYNGDFNYDGKINVDDYGIIDFNVGIQGAPFFTAGGVTTAASLARLSGVSAVPEPASITSITIMGLAAAGARRRRRRSRHT